MNLIQGLHNMRPRHLQLPADAFSPFVLLAGNSGLGAWVRAAAWCVGHGTDGEIPEAVALKIAKVEAWQSLERKGFLRREGGMVRLFHFLDTNPSAKELSARREVKARAGAKGGRTTAERRAAAAPVVEQLAPESTSEPAPSSSSSVASAQGSLFSMEPVVAAPAVAPAKEKKARTKKAKEPKPEPVEAPESEHARIKAFFFAAFAEAKGEEPAWDGR